jgi:hypothetical protein
MEAFICSTGYLKTNLQLSFINLHYYCEIWLIGSKTITRKSFFFMLCNPTYLDNNNNKKKGTEKRKNSQELNKKLKNKN